MCSPESFIANSTASSHVKFFRLATLLLLLVGASSSYFQHGEYYSSAHGIRTTPATATDVPSNREVVTATSTQPGEPPVLAYWIYGSTRDSQRMLWLLKATYHRRNQYLLLLAGSSSQNERTDLALFVKSDPLFKAFHNVGLAGRSYGVNQMGGSGLAAMLHASAFLLKMTSWFHLLLPMITFSTLKTMSSMLLHSCLETSALYVSQTLQDS